MRFSLNHNTSRFLVSVLPVLALAGCGGGDLDKSAGTTTAAVSAAVPATGAASATTGAAGQQPTVTAATLYASRPQLPMPNQIAGVTLDSTANISSVVTALSSLSKVPTTRIVFDEFVPAADYRSAAVSIRNVSYVMGELLDSYYVNQYSVQQYLDRTKEYLSTLGDVVDVWEVGNEINGEWLGTTPDVVAKMSGAYDLVKAQGKLTELTLYYNKDCWAKPANEMFTWANNNIPARMKSGLDYVLVSYYEDDCNGLQPDWPTVFHQLRQMFPNSKIGFGEVGTTRAAAKAEFINRYYTKNITEPGYVGGYFWWYFRQDMVPMTNTLWGTLNTAISKMPTFVPLGSTTTTPTAPTPAPTPAPTETWTYCATQGGICNFSGIKKVRYGANGVYVTKTLSGPVACTNKTFGNPIRVKKTCSYSNLL